MQCLAYRAGNKMLMDVLRDDTMKEPVIEHQIDMCSACRHMTRRCNDANGGLRCCSSKKRRA
jgi:predicted anti-sigma-YlaC factor YlaD